MSTQTSTLEVLSEKQLQNLLTRRLKKDGYQVIQQCIDDPNQFSDIRQCRTHSMFGIDIVAQNDNQLRIIEVKGQPKGGIASSSTIFMAGIGQILTRVTQISENIHYSLAIPNTDYYASSVRKFIDSPVLDAINLSIILILENGKYDLVR